MFGTGPVFHLGNISENRFLETMLYRISDIHEFLFMIVEFSVICSEESIDLPQEFVPIFGSKEPAVRLQPGLKFCVAMSV